MKTKSFQASDYAQLEKENVDCACCGSSSHVLAFRGDRYNFGLTTVACRDCGLLFTNPRPRTEWFDEFYRLHYRQFYESVETPDENYLNRNWIRGRHRRNADALRDLLPSRGRLLDVGCAEGTFLSEFRSRFPGWRLAGLEPSASFSEFARSYYGLKTVTTGNIDQLEDWPAGSFDLITAGHVLEHLLDPNRLFLEARRLLASRGLLFIDVPDAEGELFGIRNLHIAHVYHFDSRSLGNFAAKHGFALETLRPGPERPKWTIHLLARRLDSTPACWRPAPVDGQRIARSFARHSRTRWRQATYRWITRSPLARECWRRSRLLIGARR